MTCEEFVVTLSVSDRQSAQLAAHADACVRCGRLWQAELLMQGAQPGALVPAVSPELQQKFAARPNAKRATHPLRRIGAVFAAVSSCIAFCVLRMPRADLHTEATALLVLPFAAFALVLIAGLQMYTYRGRAGLGVPAWRRWAFAAIAVALFEGVTALEVAKQAAWHASLGVAHGTASKDCLALGLVVSCVVGAVVLAVGRRTVLVGAASSGALAGSLAGLAALMFLHLHCAAADARHLSIVHVLPLVCAIIAGAFAGRRILAA